MDRYLMVSTFSDYSNFSSSTTSTFTIVVRYSRNVYETWPDTVYYPEPAPLTSDLEKLLKRLKSTEEDLKKLIELVRWKRVVRFFGEPVVDRMLHASPPRLPWVPTEVVVSPRGRSRGARRGSLITRYFQHKSTRKR